MNEVAIVMAMTLPNTYFIFRDNRVEVTIEVNEHTGRLRVSHTLLLHELDYIRQYYPQWSLIDISIFKKPAA